MNEEEIRKEVEKMNLPHVEFHPPGTYIIHDGSGGWMATGEGGYKDFCKAMKEVTNGLV